MYRAIRSGENVHLVQRFLERVLIEFKYYNRGSAISEDDDIPDLFAKGCDVHTVGEQHLQTFDCDDDEDVIVVGDLHGQFDKLCRVVVDFLENPKAKIVFLGDAIDRNPQMEIQTILLLLLLKIQYPERVFILRGNHEQEVVDSFNDLQNDDVGGIEFICEHSKSRGGFAPAFSFFKLLEEYPDLYFLFAEIFSELPAAVVMRKSSSVDDDEEEDEEALSTYSIFMHGGLGVGNLYSDAKVSPGLDVLLAEDEEGQFDWMHDEFKTPHIAAAEGERSGNRLVLGGIFVEWLNKLGCDGLKRICRGHSHKNSDVTHDVPTHKIEVSTVSSHTFPSSAADNSFEYAQVLVIQADGSVTRNYIRPEEALRSSPVSITESSDMDGGEGSAALPAVGGKRDRDAVDVDENGELICLEDVYNEGVGQDEEEDGARIAKRLRIG